MIAIRRLCLDRRKDPLHAITRYLLPLQRCRFLNLCEALRHVHLKVDIASWQCLTFPQLVLEGGQFVSRQFELLRRSPGDVYLFYVVMSPVRDTTSLHLQVDIAGLQCLTFPQHVLEEEKFKTMNNLTVPSVSWVVFVPP